MRTFTIALVILVFLSGCTTSRSNSTPTAEDAKKFMDDVNETVFKLALDSSQASWISETYITEDSSAVAARSDQRLIDKMAQYAKDAVKFDNVQLSPDLRRSMNLLKVSLVLATPSDPKLGEEVTKIAADLDATYGKGKWDAALSEFTD